MTRHFIALALGLLGLVWMVVLWGAGDVALQVQEALQRDTLGARFRYHLARECQIFCVRDFCDG